MGDECIYDAVDIFRVLLIAIRSYFITIVTTLSRISHRVSIATHKVNHRVRQLEGSRSFFEYLAAGKLEGTKAFIAAGHSQFPVSGILPNQNMPGGGSGMGRAAATSFDSQAFDVIIVLSAEGTDLVKLLGRFEYRTATSTHPHTWWTIKICKEADRQDYQGAFRIRPLR